MVTKLKKLAIIIPVIIFVVALITVNIILLFTNDQVTCSIQINEHTFAKKDDLREILQTKGIVKPGDEYSVRYKKEMGDISTIDVNEGDAVEVGSVLFEYDSSKIDRKIESLQKRYEKISANIKELEKEISKLESSSQKSDPVLNGQVNEQEEQTKQYEKILSTTEKNRTASDVKDYELKLDEIEQEINEAEAEKEQLVVKSKISGVIKEINHVVERDNDIVMSIQTEYPNMIEGEITESQAVKLEEGQKAFVTANVFPDETYDGTLERLTMIPVEPPSLKKKQTIYPYSVQLTDQVDKLYDGYHVNVQFVLKERESAIIIPESAIVRAGEKTYVYIIKNGKLDQTNIIKGLKVKKEVEVVKGLKEGDRLVLNPTPFLKDKMSMFEEIKEDNISKKAMNSFKADQIALLMLKGFVE